MFEMISGGMFRLRRLQRLDVPLDVPKETKNEEALLSDFAVKSISAHNLMNTLLLKREFMKLNRSIVAILASASLLVLTGCGSSSDTTTEVEPDSTSAESPVAETSEPAADTEAQQGGQVVEVGEYHLELVPEAEAEGTHMDLYLQQGDSHEAIPGAQVTAQVDLPDGTQQSLEMDYDAEGEHYTALLPSSEAGEYKVAVLSDINGEKVNGRFSFTK